MLECDIRKALQRFPPTMMDTINVKCLQCTKPLKKLSELKEIDLIKLLNDLFDTFVWTTELNL